MRLQDKNNTRFRSKARTRASLLAGTILLVVLASATTLGAKEELPEVTHDGLHLVPDTQVAAAYVKPGVDFSGYDRLMILEAYVAFKKNWVREQQRSSIHRVTNRDVERMKREMAELFREVFVEELETKGGYPVVDGADTDVLLLRPAIIDLDVTAPDLDRAGRSYNFAASAGAATLFLELYDSVSGEILARVLDRQAAHDAGRIMSWSNRVTNRAAAERVLAGWAGLLRERLDAVHGGGAGRPTDGGSAKSANDS